MLHHGKQTILRKSVISYYEIGGNEPSYKAFSFLHGKGLKLLCKQWTPNNIVIIIL